MSLHWTLIAGFLYIEIGIIFIMLLSIVKPQTWRSLLTSRFLEALSRQSNLTLCSFIGILLLFFIESMRENIKYNGKIYDHEHRHHSGSILFHEDQIHLYRAQRNLYISGFALFCLFIIKRVAGLISEQGQLKISVEALKTQVENNAQFVKEQSKKASDDSTVGSKKKCDETVKISNFGDNQEVGSQIKEMIAEMENEIKKLKEEAAETKKVIESKDVQLEALKVSSLKLISKERKVEESDKDK